MRKDGESARERGRGLPFTLAFAKERERVRESCLDWYRAVETLRGLLQEVRTWPPHVLPTVQEAAMNLVRGIAAQTPEENIAGTGGWQPDAWWYQERHHGLGDSARASSSPRGPPQRRPRSASRGTRCSLVAVALWL